MPNPHRPFTPQETNLAVRLYTEGATLRQTATAIHRGTENARKILTTAGVQIRDDSRTTPRQPKATRPNEAIRRELEAAIARDRRRNHRLDIMRRASGFHALTALALLLLTFPALAQEHRHPMAGEPDPYRGYKRPGSNISCCSGRDCRPVESRFNFDLNQTEILIAGEWRPIDYDTVIGPPPPGTDYHMIHACMRGGANGDGPVVCTFMGGGV